MGQYHFPVSRLCIYVQVGRSLSRLCVTGICMKVVPTWCTGAIAFCGGTGLHSCKQASTCPSSTHRSGVVYAKTRGGGSKMKNKNDVGQANPVFSFFIKEKGSTNTSNRGRQPKQEATDEGWWPPRLFGWGQDDQAKKKAVSKKKANGFWPFPGFADFNEMWKGQLSLQRKIRKLEQEVARDYKRGDRAR